MSPIDITNLGETPVRWLEWGVAPIRPGEPMPDFLIDSDDLVTSGFAGAQHLAVDAYNPDGAATNSVRSDIYTTPVAVCGTGDQEHVGTFRVKARVYNSTDAMMRLSWQAGDGPFSANAWVGAPHGTTWCEIDLGMITIERATSGAQWWRGTIESYATSQGAYAVIIDYVRLVPVSGGYGKARGTYRYAPGVLVGVDEFTGTTIGADLDARVAPVGGSWDTSGSAGDFDFEESWGGEQIHRDSILDASPRFAILGAGALTNTQVEVLTLSTLLSVSSGEAVRRGVIARWTDSSNYLLGSLDFYGDSGSFFELNLSQRVAGTGLSLNAAQRPAGVVRPLEYYALRLLAFASGRAILQLLDVSKQSVIMSIEAHSADLASGGVLESGPTGIFDFNDSPTAPDRYYDDFQVAIPPPEPVVIYPGRRLRITHDKIERESADGTTWGTPPWVRGRGLTLPPGDSRLEVRADRNDLDTTGSPTVGHPLQVQMLYTPRVRVVPR